MSLGGQDISGRKNLREGEGRLRISDWGLGNVGCDSREGICRRAVHRVTLFRPCRG